MKTTEKYTISGMSCQSCANSIERMVSKLDTVTEVNVSFATETMSLEREGSDKAAIEQTVQDLGFGIELADDSKKKD